MMRCSDSVLYQDDALLVVEKPSGLLAVPGRGADKQDSLLTRLQAAFPDALVVHRLDMATSGLMLFARGPKMQRLLSIQFQQRQVGKRYLALVAGRVQPESGSIDLPLICDWPRRPRQIIDHDRGKPALTRYRFLDYDPERDCSRVELEPVTGRSHQLRVHLAALGHPILGDTLYGAAKRATRLLLHATHLVFVHPGTGQHIEFDSPPPF